MSSATTAYADDAGSPAKWNLWVDGEIKIGNQRTIGVFDAFAPVWQNQDSLIYFNPRYRADDQDSREYNMGVGYRHIMDDWVVGFYGFVDRNRSPFNNYFNQVTFGAEALGENWKFRINDYQPFGDRHHNGVPSAVVTGGTLMISGAQETSMRGNDIEAGYRLPINDVKSMNQFWVYGGGYHFEADGVESVTGPRGRLEYEMGGFQFAEHDMRLRLSGEIEHDSVRGTNAFAGLRIGMSFGGSSSAKTDLSPLERHMVDPVERDVDIVVNKSLEHAINPLTGDVVSSVDTLHADDDLQTHIDAAGNNSLIVFDGAHGHFTDITFPADGIGLDGPTPLTMHNGQIFTGAGGQVTLRGARTGVSATYRAPGTATTFEGLGIVLAKNNAVSGITFTQPDPASSDNYALIGTDPGNFSLSYSSFSGIFSVSNFPVELAWSTPFTATFDHNSFLNNTVGAVRINLDAGVTAAHLTYTNNIATNNGSGSQSTLGSTFTIIATGTVGPTTLTMSGNTVTGNDKAAFYSHTSGAFSSFTGTFEDNNFSNNGSGIVFATAANAASFTFRNNTLSDLNDNAIAIIGSGSGIPNLDLVVDSNHINNIANASNGISVSGVSNQLNMQITNNTISNTEGSAFLYYNGDPTVPDIHATISHNTIQNNQNLGGNAAGGISIDGFKSLDLVMDSNVFSNNAGGTALGSLGGTAPTGAMNVTFTNNTQTGGDALNMQFYGAGNACANIHGNSSTTATAYDLFNQGSGSFNLTPTDFASVNTGGFGTTGAITPVASCP